MSNLHLIEEESECEHQLRLSLQEAENVEYAQDHHRNSNRQIEELDEGCILASTSLSCVLLRHFYIYYYYT